MANSAALHRQPSRPDLILMDGLYAVARLDPDSPLPAWATSTDFWCLCRTPEELSVVCRQEAVPPGVQADAGWACLQVAGPLDLSQVGILAGLSAPLAQAGISLLTLSTFHTDYLLVRSGDLERARQALSRCGWKVTESHSS